MKYIKSSVHQLFANNLKSAHEDAKTIKTKSKTQSRDKIPKYKNNVYLTHKRTLFQVNKMFVKIKEIDLRK